MFYDNPFDVKKPGKGRLLIFAKKLTDVRYLLLRAQMFDGIEENGSETEG